MKAEMTYATMTRLTNLLEEVRQTTGFVTVRPINKYVAGEVKASGKYEWVCDHCTADAAAFPTAIQHEGNCLLARIDSALNACLPERRSVPQEQK